MGDEEILDKAIGQALGQLGQRQGRGVGGDNGAGAPDGIDLAVKVLLNGRILDDGLDDPIAVGQALQVVFDVARFDEGDVLLVHQGRGIGLQEPLARRLGDPAAVFARIFGYDVEQ